MFIVEDFKCFDRIVEKQVSLVELFWDYEEIKFVYQEMLVRKEKVCVFLKKGGEGGISYCVYELVCFFFGLDGLRFLQFFIVGLLFGILILLFLLVGYIWFDLCIWIVKILE